MEQAKKQSILLENDYLRINGLESVISISETDAGVVVDGKTLVIKGANLKAEKLSVEMGELVLSGQVLSLKFEAKKEKQSFLKRIFK